MSSNTLELYNNNVSRGVALSVEGIGAGDQISCYSSGGTQYVGMGFGDITATGDITCRSLTQTSLASEKKNFEKLPSGLDIIKHIGFVIGNGFNYSKEITFTNKKEKEVVDLYSFVSVCCRAIQEQQEIIEHNEETINNLIERIERLEATR